MCVISKKTQELSETATSVTTTTNRKMLQLPRDFGTMATIGKYMLFRLMHIMMETIPSIQICRFTYNLHLHTVYLVISSCNGEGEKLPDGFVFRNTPFILANRAYRSSLFFFSDKPPNSSVYIVWFGL